jgi:hypothetical protein
VYDFEGCRKPGVVQADAGGGGGGYGGAYQRTLCAGFSGAGDFFWVVGVRADEFGGVLCFGYAVFFLADGFDWGSALSAFLGSLSLLGLLGWLGLLGLLS